MTDRVVREVLAIVLARVEEGAAIEIPAPHREALREILDNEYARPVRLVDHGGEMFVIKRPVLGIRAKP